MPEKELAPSLSKNGNEPKKTSSFKFRRPFVEISKSALSSISRLHEKINLSTANVIKTSFVFTSSESSTKASLEEDANCSKTNSFFKPEGIFVTAPVEIHTTVHNHNSNPNDGFSRDGSLYSEIGSYSSSRSGSGSDFSSTLSSGYSSSNKNHQHSHDPDPVSSIIISVVPSSHTDVSHHHNGFHSTEHQGHQSSHDHEHGHDHSNRHHDPTGRDHSHDGEKHHGDEYYGHDTHVKTINITSSSHGFGVSHEDLHYSPSHHDHHHSPSHHDHHHSPSHHDHHQSPSHHDHHHSPSHHDHHQSPSHHNPNHSPSHHGPHHNPFHHDPHHNPSHHDPHHNPSHHDPHQNPSHHDPHHNPSHHDHHQSLSHHDPNHRPSHHDHHHSPSKHDHPSPSTTINIIPSSYGFPASQEDHYYDNHNNHNHHSYGHSHHASDDHHRNPHNMFGVSNASYQECDPSPEFCEDFCEDFCKTECEVISCEECSNSCDTANASEHEDTHNVAVDCDLDGIGIHVTISPNQLHISDGIEIQLSTPQNYNQIQTPTCSCSCSEPPSCCCSSTQPECEPPSRCDPCNSNGSQNKCDTKVKRKSKKCKRGPSDSEKAKDFLTGLVFLQKLIAATSDPPSTCCPMSISCIPMCPPWYSCCPPYPQYQYQTPCSCNRMECCGGANVYEIQDNDQCDTNNIYQDSAMQTDNDCAAECRSDECTDSSYCTDSCISYCKSSSCDKNVCEDAEIQTERDGRCGELNALKGIKECCRILTVCLQEFSDEKGNKKHTNCCEEESIEDEDNCESESCESSSLESDEEESSSSEEESETESGTEDTDQNSSSSDSD